MSEPPPVPESPPSTEPKSPLWLLLGGPPVIMFMGTLVTNGFQPGMDIGYFIVPGLVLLMILGFSPWFAVVVGKEQVPAMQAFIGISYFIGQFILCLALWMGSCALIYA